MILMISNHAVVRWLERVEGIDLGAIRAALQRQLKRAAVDSEILRAVEAETGLSADAVRAQFPRAVLEQAVACRARSIVHGGVHFALRLHPECAVVATVGARRLHHRTARQKRRALRGVAHTAI